MRTLHFGSTGEVRFRCGTIDPSTKAPEEVESDSYGKLESDDLTRDQAIGITGSWKF